MKIDLSQFRQTFMQESAEHVESMEAGLLDLRSSPGDIELLNSIFRAAHSIKGGAGSFGLSQLVRFTHALENLLDRLRSLEMPATAEVISLLLQSVDVLGVLLEAGADDPAPPEAALLVAQIESLLEGHSASPAARETPAPIPVPSPEPASPLAALPSTPAAALSQERAAPLQAHYHVLFHPDLEMLSSGNNPLLLLRNLAELGTVTRCQVQTDTLPALADLDPERSYLAWEIEMSTERSETELREVFEFVEHLARIEIARTDDEELVTVGETGGGKTGGGETGDGRTGDGKIGDGDDTSPSGLVRIASVPIAGPPALVLAAVSLPATAVVHAPDPSLAAVVASGTPSLHPDSAGPKDTPRRKDTDRGKTDRRKEDSSSIRVATDKVDRLIDLVGELVIAHVMTAQMVEDFEPACLPKLREAVAAMERGTRELHERVMAVRMLPVGTLFQRYTRVVYDIAQATGKRIHLETGGEETEVDKSMLELLGDPLTHIIRNSADHGIESPAERVAAGKPEEGAIHLRAFHRSGRVVIEIADDGAGIDTVRVRAKAVERGLIAADAQLSEDQLRLLIFEPGFSTRDQVSDLSGRGVGMDVVKRNVQQLNGVVRLASEKGRGSIVSIELPLTLAILEALLVRVAGQTLVLPLLAVIETVSPKHGQVVRVAGQGEVVLVRGESIPLLRLNRFLGLPLKTPQEEAEEALATAAAPAPSPSSATAEGAGLAGLVVIVEADSKKFGLVVEELLGQQQVVVKSLEKHLRKIDGLMGATILGDGCVAPILDVAGLAALDLFKLQMPRQ